MLEAVGHPYVVNPDSLFWKVRDRLIGKTIQRF